MTQVFEAAVQLRADKSAMNVLAQLMIEPLPYGRIHRDGQPTRRILRHVQARGYVVRKKRCYGLTRKGVRTLLTAHEIQPIQTQISALRTVFCRVHLP